MQIKILGWAGGIGANLRTTSFLVDDDMLIDTGTGLGDLPLNQMTGIRHIFLTHSHMDHIVGLPLLADSMFGVHDEPIMVHAQEETIQAIKDHIFNWVIWPDFSVSITDRVFTRVGALDNLSQGQSTFMVEMEETANILNNSSEKSLVIMDEIGSAAISAVERINIIRGQDSYVMLTKFSK